MLAPDQMACCWVFPFGTSRDWRERASPFAVDVRLARALPKLVRGVGEAVPVAAHLRHGLRDPDDAYLLTLARSAKADYLVSGDGDLTSLSDPGRR